MKYLIYARVSPKGSGYEGETSIQMQIQFCREYVKRQSGEIIGEFADEFFSGKSMERPNFREIMAKLECGEAEWDTICVYKLSRLTRSTRDGAFIFEQLHNWGKGFVSVTEPTFDFSTPMGRAMLTIFQAFNQFEREQSAENTKNKMVSIAQKGLWPIGKAPFGYKRGAKKDNKLYVDPRNAEIVRDIYNLYLDDHTPLCSIAKKYRHIFTPQHITSTVLHNQVYLGMIVYDGKIYQGQHEPIIDQKIFDQVQERLGKKSENDRTHVKEKAQKYNYLLTGLVRCHCGRFMTPASGKSSQYHYYKCTNRLDCNFSVSAEKLEEAAKKKIRLLAFPEKLKNALSGYLEENKQNFLETYRTDLDRITIALEQAEAEQEKLYHLILAQSFNAKNLDFFNAKFDKVRGEVENLKAKKDFLQAEFDRINIDTYAIAQEMADKLKTFASLIKHRRSTKRLRHDAECHAYEHRYHNRKRRWNLCFSLHRIQYVYWKRMERVTGVEPASPAWEAGA